MSQIATTSLETYFDNFREKVIGINQDFQTPYGNKPIIYADWTASGRLYGPIEKLMTEEIAPFVGNTHTETTITGCSMTMAYHHAKTYIKEQVGANTSDVLISSNSGMTGVVNKFQRILGLKIHESFRKKVQLKKEERPIVFVSHMEHHSNQTSWLETIADVEVIKPNEDGLMCLEHFISLLDLYKDRSLKIAAITSCSNVTGLKTPYYEVAEAIHAVGGLCFVDFACSAPYIDILMRPEKKEQHLDAIYFSPHKFLGGPGSSGILVFDPKLYKNQVPDNPGGGTVDWTNPWGEHKYIDEIETREDGGTPSFLQTMRVALCMKLKAEMGVERILAREKEILNRIWPRLDSISNLHILADQHRERLGVVSFYIDDLHYNLGVKLLNDHFGVQVRGGCSCAGTYGHYLLNVSQPASRQITDEISYGNLSAKPGWIRMSIHPVTSDEEVDQIMDAVEQLALHHEEWGKEYQYDINTNEFVHREDVGAEAELVQKWFGASLVD
ncbi:MAG: aminotransferase class V-fold PLP-dependent enzyme [Saprospiraceae bacterium]|nr:aminotransferase class V-fold PLP-dependent enzyme [Saprospiraceae bacterium]